MANGLPPQSFATVLPKKRGRPAGSKDTKPRAPYKEKAPTRPPYASLREMKKAEAAKKRIAQAERKAEKAAAEVARLEKLLESSRDVADGARGAAQKAMEDGADHLLLEQTPWNDYYRKLVEYRDREGNVEFKRIGDNCNNVAYNALPNEEARKEYRHLSGWLGRQRTARRKGTLEPIQLFLLNRVGVNWTPPQGPGPEKWFAHLERLKEYRRINGDTNVPRGYLPDKKLAVWVRTQVAHYRNANAGRKPALSADRIRLLEEIGFDWGITSDVKPTPWEDRFEEVCRYKEKYGHPNVPWKWEENRTLAYWVTRQRNMYKFILDGKRAPITEDQIEKLNSIGFQWNAGGKRAYDRPNLEQRQRQEQEMQQEQHEEDVAEDDFHELEQVAYETI